MTGPGVLGSEGTVTKFDWANPDCHIYLDVRVVKDNAVIAKGAVVHLNIGAGWYVA